MDVDLSLDEIIERKRIHNPPRTNDKKLHAVQMKPRKPVNKPGSHTRTYDARNKIIQKTRAKIVDARDILNQNIRDSGIDARNVLLERKKERMPMPLPLPPQAGRAPSRAGGGIGGGLHKGRFGQRIITMSNRPGGVIQTLWDPKEERPSHGGYKSGGSSGAPYQSSRLNAAAKPFIPRGYVDYDNMQELEDEEIARTLHLGNYNSQPTGGQRPRMGLGYDSYSLDMDGVEITPQGSNNLAGDPFAIYEAARNRVERPSMPPPPLGGDKIFERRQRNLVATSNLPDSLRARLFGSEPDRRVSHGIYANENGSEPPKGHMAAPVMPSMPMHQRRSPPTISMPLPLSVVNNKPGYRLLVSNLHANVTTADIRELFNDIGPMYDAHVVRPGTAEVIYKSLEHAEMAVDAYHQREFDGQPMHCVLVNPHSSNRSAHSISSRTVTTNSSGVEVDIDALHSVLFRDR
ncbi:uncharacterized protein LOC115766336 [Drosophila novamexicana]|uniref:uncharacterized protein LOC115766336 n=1 Tax=Drosophila novamexicana TaxID=47314 RepID=UPI0011E5C6E3|nr:uncharacterized protein LOC115766336 [Drosophila novamexicana]